MPTAELRNDRIEIETTWNEKELVQRVPGARWIDRDRVWAAPLSWATCMTLRGIFGPTLKIGPELNKWALTERAERVDPAMTLRPLTAGDIRFWPLSTNGADNLYDFQRAGVQFLLAAGDALLADDMGTGKTIQALTALRELERYRLDLAPALPGPPVLPALVICPNSVKTVWEREAAIWFPEATPYVVNGSAAVKQKTLDTAAQDPTALVIINIEAVRTFSRLAPYGSIALRRCRECSTHGEVNLKATSCQVHPKTLNKIPFASVIVDEAHRIKDPASQQTRAVWALCHGPDVRRRYALTGTPLANDPSDLWSIMHAVAKTDFPTRGRFIDRYCLQAWNPFGALQIVGVAPDTREEFYRILDPRMRRMPKALVLPQLPPKVREVRYVEMVPKQARAYRQMHDEFVAEVGGESLLIAPGNMPKAIRLMQLASAYCEVLGDGSVRLTEPSPKVDELIAIMEELGDTPFVFCAEHRQLIDLASARLSKLGVRHGLITGGQTTSEREQHLYDFQAGKTRVLGFTIKAGGTGLTMTAAGAIVFLQRSWSMIDNQQAEDRVHRIGSELFHDSILVIDVVTRDTIEQLSQIPSLWQKFERLEEIRRDRQTLAAAGLNDASLAAEEEFILSSHLGS